MTNTNHQLGLFTCCIHCPYDGYNLGHLMPCRYCQWNSMKGRFIRFLNWMKLL